MAANPGENGVQITLRKSLIEHYVFSLCALKAFRGILHVIRVCRITGKGENVHIKPPINYRKLLLMILSAIVVFLGYSGHAFSEVATLCVLNSSHASRRQPSVYVSKSSTCRADFNALSLGQGITQQELEDRLERPIVGVSYEFHLAISGAMEATGWAMLESSGDWKGRLRISWKDLNEQRHEAGDTIYDSYMGGYERGQVTLANGGNAFAWFEPRSLNDPIPVLFAAWSNGNQRICSKLDIFDRLNTLEWFNVIDGTLDNRCPAGFKPPEWLLKPHFGPAREF